MTETKPNTWTRPSTDVAGRRVAGVTRKGTGEAPVPGVGARRGKKRKKEPQGHEVDDGFLVDISKADGGDQENNRQQKQQQKRRLRRFSDKDERENINP
jgi:hypothetical protein